MNPLYLLVIHWFASLFFQSFFLHRYAAHRMFKTSPFMEKVFYFFTYLSQGPSFLNPRTYSILHQKHHAYSDTDKDPHSPTNHNNIVNMMIKTYHEYMEILDDLDGDKTKDDKNIKHHYPSWRALDRFASSKWNTYLWIIIYVAMYAWLVTNIWFYLLLPFHFFMGPIQGAIVNWCGHHFGYRNHDTTDNSKNTLLWDIPLMGELYQNNHHHACQRVNFASKWYEIDPTFLIMKVMNSLKIIQIRRSSL